LTFLQLEVKEILHISAQEVAKTIVADVSHFD
jgi:hypothetical protein